MYNSGNTIINLSDSKRIDGPKVDAMGKAFARHLLTFRSHHQNAVTAKMITARAPLDKSADAYSNACDERRQIRVNRSSFDGENTCKKSAKRGMHRTDGRTNDDKGSELEIASVRAIYHFAGRKPPRCILYDFQGQRHKMCCILRKMLQNLVHTAAWF